MSIESMSRVLNHSRARGTTKLVLIGIANHDGDGGAWPSINTLCRYANADRRTVQRAIATLVEMGEVIVHANDGGTRSTRNDQRPNRYEIIVKERPIDGVAPTPPRAPNGAAPMVQRGGVGDANGAAPTPPEPSLEPSRNQGGVSASIKSPAGVGDARPAPPQIDLGGQPSDGVLNPDRCGRHQGLDLVPPCGACRDARLAHERAARAGMDAAARDDEERLRADVEARRFEAQLRRDAIDACRACDASGYRNGRPCSHDPAGDDERARIAAEWAARIRGRTG